MSAAARPLSLCVCVCVCLSLSVFLALSLSLSIPPFLSLSLYSPPTPQPHSGAYLPTLSQATVLYPTAKDGQVAAVQVLAASSTEPPVALWQSRTERRLSAAGPDTATWHMAHGTANTSNARNSTVDRPTATKCAVWPIPVPASPCVSSGRWAHELGSRGLQDVGKHHLGILTLLPRPVSLRPGARSSLARPPAPAATCWPCRLHSPTTQHRCPSLVTTALPRLQLLPHPCPTSATLLLSSALPCPALFCSPLSAWLRLHAPHLCGAPTSQRQNIVRLCPLLPVIRRRECSNTAETTHASSPSNCDAPS